MYRFLRRLKNWKRLCINETCVEVFGITKSADDLIKGKVRTDYEKEKNCTLISGLAVRCNYYRLFGDNGMLMDNTDKIVGKQCNPTAFAEYL